MALGNKTQIGWGITANWYLDIGWGMKDKIDYQWVGNSSALRAAFDGMVSALPIGGYMNPITHEMILSPHTQELLASGKKVYHLSVGKEAIDKMIESKKGFPSPLVTVPPGAVKGWDQEITTGVGSVVWAASLKMPEKLAYETVKLIIENCDKFKTYHALGKLMTPEALCYGLTEKELHPGAYRAYKEAGLLK